MHLGILLCLLVFISPLLGGCETLPRQGPMASAVEKGPKLGVVEPQAGRDYALIALDARTASALGTRPKRLLSKELTQKMPGRTHTTIVSGDRLMITIWEPGPDGLFSGTEGKSGGAPIEAIVDQDGYIFIPYIGRMEVVGSGVEKLRARIQDNLTGKAVDPQVQVALAGQEGHKFSILGDVAAPGRFDIPASGLRLSEGLALAGGSKEPSFESEVSISRNALKASAQMDDVMGVPQNDIWLAPRDIIQVRHNPRSFSAFGAVRTPGKAPFGAENVSLAEALATVGGLNDNWADTGGVFILRFEDPVRLTSIGLKVPAVKGGGAPVVYQLNFAAAGALLLAQEFEMHDKDVVYVANAPGAELRKFLLSFVTPIFSTTQMIDSVGSN